MRKEYKYSNLKQETINSGIVTLEPMKKRKTTQTKPPRQPSWAITMEQRINKRLDKHDQLFEQIISRLDNIVDKNNLKE